MKRLTAFLLALVAILAAPAALAAAATQFRVVAPSTAIAGTAFNIQVQAVDNNQFVDSGFLGSVVVGSSGDVPPLVVPASYTFASGDGGTKIFSVTLYRAGNQTITVSSPTGGVGGTLISGTSSQITVTGGTAATLSITAPALAAANTAFNVTVSAKDSSGNAATSYAGTVRFTTTDADSNPPAAETKLTNGTATVSATLKTVGKWRITAADTVNFDLSATSAEIDVTIPPAQLTLAPTSLDFGGQSMKTTSPAQTVKLTNSGGVATNVSSVSTSTYYAVTHDCTTVNPGAFCTASVSFTPTAEGTLAGTLTIVSGAGTQTVPLTGTGEKSLVTHYYRSILRRAPDAAGKSYWNAEASRVTALGANVNETWYAMAGEFYFSSEYLALARSNADFVTDLYNTFFNRAPDTAGFNDWTTKLSQGLPREVVLAEFMFSTEFTTFTKDIFGTAVVRPEIDMDVDFYRGILGRLPDDAGFNSWLTRLRNSQCAGSAAVSLTVEDISSLFALSAEYTARNRTNSQYVGDLYNAFLRRGGDLAGVQFWIDEIASGRQTREAVRKQFVASPEFSARVNAVIAAGCFSAPPTVDTDVNGNPIPAPTGPAGARMCEEFGGPSPGSGPGPCGSYQIPIGNCSSGMTGANAINKAWMYVLEDYTPTSPRLGNSIRWGMARDVAMVFRLKTGPVNAFPNTLLQNLNQPLSIAYEEYTSLGTFAPRFVTLSETKCDFDYSKTLSNGVLNGCYKPMGLGDGLLATITPTGADPAVGFPFCQLKPNTTYYINIRYEDARTIDKRGIISCPAGGNCGQTMGIN